jgi:hypothetical protein
MSGELNPNDVKRRVLPDCGERKLRERIHRESDYIDKHGNLPYKFSGIKKSKSQRFFECCKCGHTIQASKNTIMLICSKCGELSKVKEI